MFFHIRSKLKCKRYLQWPEGDRAEQDVCLNSRISFFSHSATREYEPNYESVSVGCAIV